MPAVERGWVRFKSEQVIIFKLLYVTHRSGRSFRLTSPPPPRCRENRLRTWPGLSGLIRKMQTLRQMKTERKRRRRRTGRGRTEPSRASAASMTGSSCCRTSKTTPATPVFSKRLTHLSRPATYHSTVHSSHRNCFPQHFSLSRI